MRLLTFVIYLHTEINVVTWWGLLNSYPRINMYSFENLELLKRVDKLTPNQRVLFHILNGNKGKVVTREVLYQMVYGRELKQDERSICVLVHRTRLKLGNLGSLIKTVRGEGFMIL
jgi:DNA-binding response OmpR family regulator